MWAGIRQLAAEAGFGTRFYHVSSTYRRTIFKPHEPILLPIITKFHHSLLPPSWRLIPPACFSGTQSSLPRQSTVWGSKPMHIQSYRSSILNHVVMAYCLLQDDTNKTTCNKRKVLGTRQKLRSYSISPVHLLKGKSCSSQISTWCGLHGARFRPFEPTMNSKGLQKVVCHLDTRPPTPSFPSLLSSYSIRTMDIPLF